MNEQKGLSTSMHCRLHQAARSLDIHYSVRSDTLKLKVRTYLEDEAILLHVRLHLLRALIPGDIPLLEALVTHSFGDL